MKNLLTNHWLAKLLSLLLAIGIWFLVNSRVKSDFPDGFKPERPTLFR